MFAKLLKYEWRATRKIQGILALSILGLGLIGSIILRLMLRADYDSNAALTALGGVSVGLMWLSMYACLIASFILLLGRFYKNKFTDEGYLTFTLPVTGHQILWSSIVNIILWELIIYAALVVAVLFILLIGIGPELTAVDWNTAAEELSFLREELSAVTGPFWLMLLSMPVMALANVILMLTAITLGCAAAKKHKILASFGIYYGLTMAISTVSSVVSTTIVTAQIMSGKEPSLWMVSLFTLILYAALGIGGYLLTENMIRTKLNLS